MEEFIRDVSFYEAELKTGNKIKVTINPVTSKVIEGQKVNVHVRKTDKRHLGVVTKVSKFYNVYEVEII